MRQINPYPLWLGHVGDAAKDDLLLSRDIAAVIDLAGSERPMALSRGLVYCRFPLVDAAGNPPWLLASAIKTVTMLLRSQVATFLYCSGGMSRSPAIAAAAMNQAFSVSMEEALLRVAQVGPIDVTPGLLRDVVDALESPSA